MRKISQITLVLMGAIAFVNLVNAQVRSTDLQMTITSPSNNSEILPTNGTNDTIWLEFIVRNSGPDAILPNDTIWFWDRTSLFLVVATSEIAKDASMQFTRNDLNLFIPNISNPSDVSVNLCLKLVNQSTVFYNQTTTATVTFEDPDTANNWDCVDIVLKAEEDDDPSSLFEMEDKSRTFNLYPNPASNTVRIPIASEYKDQITLTLRDITGRSILINDQYKNFKTEEGYLDLDISHLKEGFYMVELNDGKLKSTTKLTIKR